MDVEEIREEIVHLNKLKKEHKRRFRALELQQARDGAGCDPKVLTEMEDIHRLVDNIDQKIAELQAQRPMEMPSDASGQEQTVIESSIEEAIKDISEQESDPSLFSQMIEAFSTGNKEKGEETYNLLQDSEDDAEQRFKNGIFYLYLLYQYGDISALSKLQDKANEVEDISGKYCFVNRLVGSCYESVNNYDKAANSYEKALMNADSEDSRSDLIVSIARCLYHSGKTQDAYGRIMHGIGEMRSISVISSLYAGLATLYELEDNAELRAIALEKALDGKPNDTQLRFNAAYSYAGGDLHALSLLHYGTVLKFKPEDRSSLNNIAVEFDKLNMPAKSVKYYKRAFEHGETLAAANLAYKYLQVGFAEEARKLLEEAKKFEDLHPNVGSAIASLSQQESQEAKTEKNTLRTAREQQRFLLTFAGSYFTEQTNTFVFNGQWRDERGAVIDIASDGNAIEANWENGDKKYYFKGDICNRAARITKYEDRSNQYYFTKLADIGYAYLSDDDIELSIMFLKDGEHSLLSLQRVITKNSAE